MTNIPELIKEAHDNAVERGFYDCPECENGIQKEPGLSGIDIECGNCNGTSINPNRNIGELLMLIVSELGEALEAHRCGKFAFHNRIAGTNIKCDDWNDYAIGESETFELAVKDTFEDEIADVFIRLFDLCAYLGIDAYFEEMEIHTDNVGEMLIGVVKEITNYNFCNDKNIWMAFVLSSLDGICQKLNIPIEKHIKAKMAYNRTRPHKHGKGY